MTGLTTFSGPIQHPDEPECGCALKPASDTDPSETHRLALHFSL